MSPRVSVILPTFNRLEFLEPALTSLQAQTFRDFELIIADDGSDAATRAFLQRLADPPRVRIVWLNHCGRPGMVRNAALRLARGDYIAFLDSDDLWHPDKLARQLASLARHPQRQWSCTAFELVDAAGAPLDARAPARVASGWIAEQMLNDEFVIALPSVLVARPLIERLGAFDETLTMCEDDELWLRLAAASELDALDAPLTWVRRHDRHGGDDATAWRDRRRVFEKALGTTGDARLQAILRRLRAETSAGLARSLATGGNALPALASLADSAAYSWRYGTWWRRAPRTLLLALAATASARRLR
jgi:glycosyltransferase involved in cell wall biosynthesis